MADIKIFQILLTHQEGFCCCSGHFKGYMHQWIRRGEWLLSNILEYMHSYHS